MIFDASAVEDIIGYSFKDKMLLRKCFTHSSFANEHGEESNERLEFFGDAVLELVVTEHLFQSGEQDEGVLTDLRQKLVSRQPLLKIVKKTRLDEHVLLGNGQYRSARSDEKLFSSVYEALVAGIYIDGGMVAAKRFIKRTLLEEYAVNSLLENGNEVLRSDVDFGSKTRLQEFVQKRKLGTISYEVLERTGPDHDPVFRVAVYLSGNPLADGEGKNKRSAQSRAAASALDFLEKQEGNRD